MITIVNSTCNFEEIDSYQCEIEDSDIDFWRTLVIPGHERCLGAPRSSIL